MRDDLLAIKPMEAAGWITTYSAADKKRMASGYPIPHDTVGFEKGIMNVWKAVKDKENIDWRYAELINGEYCNHRWITIEEAVKL